MFSPSRPWWEDDEVVEPGPGQRPTRRESRFGRISTGQADPRRAADLVRVTQQNQYAPQEQARQERTEQRNEVQLGRVPHAEATDLSERIDAFANLNRAISGFDDEFSGLGSRVENFAQSYVDSVGTPGQNQWWSRFFEADNIARNRLFGASLSPGESQAFERTTVHPGMSPEQVRANLSERLDLARGALRRRIDYLRAQGYNEESINALVGSDNLSSLAGGPQQPGTDGRLLFNDEARPPQPENPLTPEQQRRYDEWNRANPNATAEQLDAFVYGLTGSRLGNAADLVRARDRGGFMRPGADAQRPDQRPPDISDARGQGGIGESVDAFVRGAADIPTIGLADEIAALGDTLAGDGSYGENLWRQRGVDQYDTENNFGARFAGQMAGGFALPTRVPQAFMRGGAREGARRMAGEGAAFGGAYGFGSSEGDLADRITEGAVSIPIGAATGYGMGRVLGRFAVPRDAPRLQQQADAARAASELGIDLPRFVAGGPTAQRLATTLEQSPFGARPIAEGTERLLQQSQEALDRISGRLGGRMEPEGAGEAGRRGGLAFDESAGRIADNLYGEAERLSGETRVALPGAAAELDRQIAELADTPGVVPTMLAPLQAIRGRIDGEWTPASIRRMRTHLRDQFVESGMQQGDASRRATLVARAAEEDMIGQLRARGQGDAANAWQRASDNYAAYQTTLEQTIIPIIGRAGEFSGQRVARNLESAARGEGERLSRFLDAIPPQDAQEVRSSIIEGLGRASSGNQDAAGEAFSLDTFLSNWNRIKASRDLIFDEETRRGLNNLAMIAQSAKAAGRTRNRSNTGTIISNVATYGPLGGVAAGYGSGSESAGTGSMLLFAMAVVAQRGGARLLASPKFAQRLANTPQAPADAARYWNRPWVSQMARQNPAIANDLMQVQQRIVSAANENTVPSVAASADEEDRERDRRSRR